MQVQVTRAFDIPEDMESVNQLEEAIAEFGRKLMAELLVTVVRLYERKHYCCRNCRSSSVEPRGTKPRHIALTFGEVTIDRARVFCRECKTLSQPADGLLHELAGGSISHKLRELVSLCAASWPFEIAEGAIEDLCKVRISHETIRQLTEKEGQRVAEEQAEEAAEAVESKPAVNRQDGEVELVCIEMDGGYVHSRDNQEGMEGKVGLIYSDREKVGKNRYLLKDRRLVVSFAGSERLGELCYLEAKEKGVEAAKRRAVLGDGASWIWGQKDTHFPEARAILDLFHLKRAVWNALRKAELPEEGRGIVGKGIVEALEGGGVDVACGLIEELMDVCGSGKEELGGLVRYIRNNREAIPSYVQLREEGYPVGSGAMEKGVDLVINRRMKGKRAMRWTRNGADAIAALRVLRLNGDWKEHWDNRKVA